jgi:hypothetical protein
MATADPVATAVLAEAEGAGAVKFEGWLAAGETVEDGYRLFTDADFLEWLMIPSNALLHQIAGSDRKDHGEGRSLIWVKRHARITWCRSGFAHEFGEMEAGDRDDPTASRPPPYHGGRG